MQKYKKFFKYYYMVFWSELSMFLSSISEHMAAINYALCSVKSIIQVTNDITCNMEGMWMHYKILHMSDGWMDWAVTKSFTSL